MNKQQARAFSVLKDVISVLNRHSLKYYMAYGSCLGTVRHGGFIPWDDDIDILMPRCDYEEFRTKYFKELPEFYEIKDPKIDKEFKYLFIKIHDSRTTYVETQYEPYPSEYMGIFIDIFPLDGMPLIDQETYLKKIAFFRSLNYVFRDKENANTRHKLIKKVLRFVLNLFFDKNFFIEKIEKMVGNYDFYKSKKVINIVTTRYNMNHIFPYTDFLEGKTMKYEGLDVCIPYNYEHYLTTIYGDYMKIPSQEEIKNAKHTYAICDTEKPYKFYAKQKWEQQRK